MKRIGIITSGGDAPGTNACVRTAVRRGFASDVEVMGIYDSWDGLLKDKVRRLERADVVGIVQTAGTILRSARSRLFLEPGDAETARKKLLEHGIEGLLVIGGNGSQTAAHLLAQTGFPVIGVPKTIDNDLEGTELTVGFLTAVEWATHALDNLRATAEANSRVMVVEVMGRDVGWIAVEAGIAGGADLVLIPEREFTLDDVYSRLHTRHEVHGRNYSIVVIAEGALDKDKRLDPRHGTRDYLGRARLGGVGQFLAREIERKLGYGARSTQLGYLQRCAAPIAADRVLATRLTDTAFELLTTGHSGLLVGSVGLGAQPVPLAGVVGKLKKVSPEHLRLAEVFG